MIEWLQLSHMKVTIKKTVNVDIWLFCTTYSEYTHKSKALYLRNGFLQTHVVKYQVETCCAIGRSWPNGWFFLCVCV